MIQIQVHNRNLGFKRRVCERCKRIRFCCQHHIDLVRNSDRVVWLCSNAGSVLLYKDPCHQWVHENRKKAKEDGFFGDGVASPYKKRHREKACNHSPYFDPDERTWKCVLCKAKMSEEEVTSNS